MEVPDEFFAACARQGIEVKPFSQEALTRYLGMLLETNQQMNLTSIRDPREAWMRHIFDSLTLLPLLKLDADRKVLDLGSGGGLPAIPLAILQPAIRWTLVESTAKKARFLQSVVDALDLKQVCVCADRAETLGRDPQYRETFDLATARAVARLPTLVELTVPFLRVGGRLLAMKGEKAPEEIQEARHAMERLRCRVLRTVEIDERSTVVILKKDAPTPKAYPRENGKPAKQPL